MEFLTGVAMDSRSGRSSRVRVTLWSLIGVVAAFLVISGLPLESGAYVDREGPKWQFSVLGAAKLDRS
jgi:hypothetical protein